MENGDTISADDNPTGASSGEGSADVRPRVMAASALQDTRLTGRKATRNADIPAREVTALCKVTPRGKEVLHAAMRQLHLSARGYHRVLKVSWTIADLEGAELIDTPHIAEALQYRKREGHQAEGPRNPQSLSFCEETSIVPRNSKRQGHLPGNHIRYQSVFSLPPLARFSSLNS